MSEDLVAWHHRILNQRGFVISKPDVRALHQEDPAEAARLDALRLSGQPIFSKAEIRRAKEEGRAPLPDFDGRGRPIPKAQRRAQWRRPVVT